MRSTSGYASIQCILLHQLQPRDFMAAVTRGMPNDEVRCRYGIGRVVTNVSYALTKLQLTDK